VRLEKVTNYTKVRDFHKKFGIKAGAIGHIPPVDRVLLRTRLMVEELGELVEAMQKQDYVNAAKECADLLYVVYGAAVEFGFPIDEVFHEVHRSNMTKTPAVDSGGKLTKGDNYDSADVAAVLDREIRKRAPCNR